MVAELNEGDVVTFGVEMYGLPPGTPFVIGKIEHDSNGKITAAPILHFPKEGPYTWQQEAYLKEKE